MLRRLMGPVLLAAALAALFHAGCSDSEGPLFARLSTTEADAIEFTHDGCSLFLTRDGDGWLIAMAAGPARADSSAVGELLDVLGRATRRDIVTGGHDQLGTLGLDGEGTGRIVIRSGGVTLVETLVGAEAPGESRVFLRPGGGRDVFVSPDGLAYLLERPLDDWRDRSIMSFRLPDVCGIEIVNRGERMVIAPVDGRWHMLQPVEHEVYKGFVDGLLYSLAELEAAGFADGLAPSRSGFGDGDDEPRGSVTVRLSNGPPQSVTFGAPLDDMWCVMRPDRADVYLVPREFAELIFGDETAEPSER